MRRREFLKTGIAAAAGLGVAPWALGNEFEEGLRAEGMPTPRADSVIMIWLPGGVAQTDTWDPKTFTPYTAGMKGSELLGTCPSIPTSADGIFLGEGLEHTAKMMHRGAILRTLTNETKFGAVHLKAQYYAKTGYLFPAGFKAPSMGSVVSRSVGRRHPYVPAYIDIGRDINTSNEEYLFINEYMGPGFLGVQHAPFMIPEPAEGLKTLNAVAGMRPERLDRRQAYLETVAGMTAQELREANKVKDYMKVMEDARAMMDSPVKSAFNFRQEESEDTLKAYDVGHRFGWSCLLARRLVETGARYVEVEYQYAPFKGFDMHEDGQKRMAEMKAHIDRPIGTMLRELDERGLLDRTLVVIATEFGRTIADRPSAGQEAEGFTESSTGETLVIENEKMYGFHGHFSSCNSMLFFGGGIKGGTVYGKTADRHPMVPVEGATKLMDAYATIYHLMGIASDVYYVTEGRPVYVTDLGYGAPIRPLMA
ncbi:MAG TPA: DUF1501 domain-containing protein [Candidatus Hydrogenedentes bacterium]|nr:DUF1501 domain-containing protein [Candidatus Hydrogenedentota bacterium]